MDEPVEAGPSRSARKRKQPCGSPTSSHRGSIAASFLSERNTLACQLAHGCGQTFACEANRERHEKAHRSNIAYVCETCKGKRKCYIFERGHQIRSHLANRRIHPPDWKPPKDVGTLRRELTAEEIEDKLGTRHRAASFNGAAPVSHVLRGSTSVESELSGISTPSAQTVPLSTWRSKTSGKDSVAAPGTASGDEGATKREHGPPRVTGGSSQHPKDNRAVLDADSHRAGKKPHRLFADEAGQSNKHTPGMSREKMERIWDDPAHWDSYGSSGSSSGRGSPANSRAATLVPFTIPQRTGGNATGSHVQQTGEITGPVNRYLKRSEAADPWNPMRLDATRSSPKPRKPG